MRLCRPRLRQSKSKLSPPRPPCADGSIHLLRGHPLEVEAALSRPSDRPVNLLFRPVAAGPQAAFEKLPMEQIEKINGFAARINDLSEDIELCVAVGGAQSDHYRASVYDPLALNSVEITTKYADYLQLADRTEVLSAADVAAPVGSHVMVKFVTNRPVKDGKVEWVGLPAQMLRPDTADPNAAVFSFDVNRDATYQFTIADVDGQEYQSPAPAAVRAIKDEPPTVVLKYPLGPTSLHPMGEINFQVEASDDFGLAGVDLVYLPHTSADAREIRVPLPLPVVDSRLPLANKPLDLTLRLALQDLSPRLAPGETISYYFEARDRKPGQPPAATDLNFLTVRPYETWASFNEHHGSPEEQGKSLEDLVKRTWDLHRQKEAIPAPEFGRQADELAAWMIDADSGRVATFVALPRGWKVITPDVQAHLDKGNEYCRQAHSAIHEHDTGKAATLVRFAMGEQALAALRTTQQSSIAPDDTLANSAANANAQQAKTLFETMKLQAQVLPGMQDQQQKNVQNEDKGVKQADAEKQLAKIDQGAIEATLADLESRAGKLVAHQRELREKTHDLAKDMADGAKPSPQQARELKADMNRQVQLKVDMENLCSGPVVTEQPGPGRRQTRHGPEYRRRGKGLPPRQGEPEDVERGGRADGQQARCRHHPTEGRRTGDGAGGSFFKHGGQYPGQRLEIRSHPRQDRGRQDRAEPCQTGGPAGPARRAAGRRRPQGIGPGDGRRHGTPGAPPVARDLADKPDIEKLAQGAKAVPLARQLAEDSAKRSELAGVVKRVSNRIEAEMQARISAEKLYSAQREEFPPHYRELVNKYYEALSQMNK